MNKTILSCLRMATALLAAAMLLMPITADAQARKRKAITHVSKATTTRTVQNNATPAKQTAGKQSGVDAPTVGKLTLYYVKSSTIRTNYGDFKPGDIITDSYNINYTMNSYGKNKYKLVIEYQAEPQTVYIPKSNVNVVTYTANQLAISQVGQAAMFKSKDGLTARIFKSHNNGHRYYQTDGEPAPASWTTDHEGCYVLSVESVSSSDYKSVFEEQLKIDDGHFVFYEKGLHGLYGVINDDWGNANTWDAGQPAFDARGNLLCDQWSNEGYITDYYSIAYIASEDALYFNGKLYYRQPNATPAVVEAPVTESSSQTTVLDKSAPIYRSVEQMPQFPGGDAALLTYIKNHINYPDCNVQGRVVLQFVVETDGSVGDVKVVRSVAPELDREAVRVVKSLPKFIPGRQNGQPVRVWYTLPVGFNR